MKKSRLIQAITIITGVISFTLISACSNDDDMSGKRANTVVTEDDKVALLFMLEEEKLARDTYTYLNDLWSLNQFANIKNSEQNHMNKIESLLIQNSIDYTILPMGEFINQDLQNFYNQFVIDGAVSQYNALQIGATIEDLDIVDLQEYINDTTNTVIQSVFESLQCGSRNHLRSFVSGIENGGNTYTPQFLTQEAYDSIIAGSSEQCN
ncbi:DUF2202 domain-containing protein [Psychroserpens mesophilus]|uniref:DUF2202 domain-containing protein n=1 Tax=Psychroserpens mesophilus TaxID=325473 RepID=UPI003D64C953